MMYTSKLIREKKQRKRVMMIIHRSRTNHQVKTSIALVDNHAIDIVSYFKKQLDVDDCTKLILFASLNGRKIKHRVPNVRMKI